MVYFYGVEKNNIMKKTFLLLASVAFVATLFAQTDESKPYRVSKAIAYSKSRPLHELAAVLTPDKTESIHQVKEGNNKLEFEVWTEVSPDKGSQNVQTEMGKKLSRGPVQGFPGQGATGVFPPDTDGDVSENHFIQVVNSKYNVYDKNGVKLLGPLNLSTLWAELPGPWNGTNDGDPIVLYDEEADRWMITQFSVFTPIKYELFAVSETNDPLGAYHLYSFSFDMMNDYPKIGVWSDGYYATYNMHNNGFQGARITVVERDKMLMGDPGAQMIEFHRSNQASLMPADIDGENVPEPGLPCPIMDIDNYTLQVQLWDFNTNWENPNSSSLTLGAAFDVSPFSIVPNTNDGVGGFVSQPGTDQKLDGLGNMIMNRLAYRKFDNHESMVVTHAIKTNSGSGIMRAAIRWYEFRRTTGNWELYQEGTYSPDNNNRWMSSAAMNASGDIALGYSVSNSTNIYPSIRYTGRRNGDPLGQMTIEEVEVKTGTTKQNHWRWGDYACMNVDPSDDSTFWFTTEYNGWKTWICSFNLGEISAPSCDAGEDGYVCTDDGFETSGSGTGVLSMEWSSDGDGFFYFGDQFNSTYVRGDQDIQNGGCTLTLTVTGFDSIQTSSDDMYLNIVDNPECSAGEDASIYENESYTLHGTSTYPGAILWTSAGDGVFTNATDLNAIYTPGTNDLASGGVRLNLHVEAMPPCQGSDDDDMYLGIITGMREVDKNLPRLSIFPNPTQGVFTIKVDHIHTHDQFTYLVYTNFGKEVYREVVHPQSQSFQKIIDMSDFVPGIYFLTIKTKYGLSTQKLIKE